MGARARCAEPALDRSNIPVARRWRLAPRSRAG